MFKCFYVCGCVLLVCLFPCVFVCVCVWVLKHLWPEGIWSFLSGFPSFLYIFYICDLTTSSWLYGFVVQCFERERGGAEGVFRFLKHLPFVLFLCVLLQRTWVDCCSCWVVYYPSESLLEGGGQKVFLKVAKTCAGLVVMVVLFVVVWEGNCIWVVCLFDVLV